MSPDTEHEPGYFGKEEPGSATDEHPGDASTPAATATATMTAPATEEIHDDRHMGHLDAGHTHGPTDNQYFTVFWVLLGLTALEVSTYFWESWFGEGDVVRRVGVAVLLTIMVIKFALIAGFFMHLRFDAALVKRVFTFGLGVALVIYLIAMTSMNMWTDNGHQRFDDPPPEVTTTTLAPEGG